MISLDKSETKPMRKIQKFRKVYYGFYEREFGKPHPVIRLGGKYLTDFGFTIGDKIQVTFDAHKITIQKVLPEVIGIQLDSPENKKTLKPAA